MKIVLFYTDTESFNFFTDQLAEQLNIRGHEVFILDLMNPPAEAFIQILYSLHHIK